MLLLSPTSQSKGQVGRGPTWAHPPCKGYTPKPLACHQAEYHPCPSEAPCVGAQSHTETRFLLNMFLISEERQGGRAASPAFMVGVTAGGQGQARQRGTSSHGHWPQLPWRLQPQLSG